MESGAVLASHGSNGYYKAPLWSKVLGRMHGVHPRQKDSPVFLVFLPNLPLRAPVQRQTGDTGGTGVEVGGLLCSGGLQRDLSSLGMQEVKQSPFICHDPAVAPPDGKALALPPNSPAGVGHSITPSTDQSLGGPGAPWLPLPSPSLSAICARVVKGVN